MFGREGDRHHAGFHVVAFLCSVVGHAPSVGGFDFGRRITRYSYQLNSIGSSISNDVPRYHVTCKTPQGYPYKHLRYEMPKIDEPRFSIEWEEAFRCIQEAAP